MKKILLLGAGLLVSVMNVNAMGGGGHHPTAPFIGINTSDDGRCHIITEGGEFTYKGPAETKLTENKNRRIATCKAEYSVDEEFPVEIDGRVGDIPCRIGIPGTGHFDGTGGFTVSKGGVVTGNCKVDK